MKNILIATSISPKNIEKQIESFSTWDALGGRIVSLNHEEEFDSISTKVPFEVVKADRSAKTLLGKPFIFIDSFLDLFKQSPESHLMIVNSDIYLSEPARMRQIIEEVDADLFFGQRVDVERPDSTEGDLFGGFDYFLLTKDAIQLYPKSDFCMGAPWWDHWMPIVPLVKGKRAVLCSEPLVLHIKHESAWGLDPLLILGWHMAYHLKNFWGDLSEKFTKYTRSDSEAIAYHFGSFFVQYFLTRQNIDWNCYPNLDQISTDLKNTISWNATDIFPVLTLDFVMRAVERYDLI
ncbi:MAG: hypothetical protein KDD56_05645 [Bdellovibrionales bacterium]|nr:hypothetical protein [Bdellovibrionales bacterium]